MTLYLWIIFIGIFLLTAFPLLSAKKRSTWNIIQTIIVMFSIIIAIVAIEIFYTPPIMPIVFIIIVTILADKSTYTKTGLIITGMAVLILSALAYYLFHDDPDYVQTYIDKNPDLASMHLSVDGENLISKQGEVKRPLASVVKTIIAIEFANQVVEGKIDPDEQIPLVELEKFYLANTDGGAHPNWLKEMKEGGPIKNDAVSLQEIAKGMIMFSSNANTDFLLDKLGPESINHVIESLCLENHDPVYPLVSSLLVPTYLNAIEDKKWSTSQLIERLQSLSLEDYRELSWEIHHLLKHRKADFFNGSVSIPMDLQKIWSDRLSNATVEDYGKVMSAISNDTATLPGGEDILRNIMEWPMKVNVSNQEIYAHLGMKGGSTAFVLNQALYVENLDGRKLELIIFTEGFSIIEQIKMEKNMNSFLKKVLTEHF